MYQSALLLLGQVASHTYAFVSLFCI